MEYPKIEIRNFGPIKEACFDLKKYNVIIGEQASGKSYISKLIYFFRSLPSELLKVVVYYINYERPQNKTNFENYNEHRYLNQRLIKESVNYYNLIFKQVSFNEIGEIKYTTQYGEIVLNKKGIEIQVLSKIIEDILNNLEIQGIKEDNSLSKYLNVSAVSSIFRKYFPENNDSFYVPAGRMYNRKITKSNVMLINKDPLELKFADFYNNLDIGYYDTTETDENGNVFEFLIDKALENKKNNINLLTKNIIKGKYIYQNHKEFIDLGNEKIIPLKDGSTGQKETARLTEILKFIIMYNLKEFMYIEEPEAHIYPIAQYNLTKLLALFVNNDSNNQLLITTHSPYILGALNNLLYAFKMSQFNNEEINKIIPKEFWINPNEIGAYKIKEGVLVDIFDTESGLICNEEIDEVSALLNDEYAEMSNYYE